MILEGENPPYHQNQPPDTLRNQESSSENRSGIEGIQPAVNRPSVIPKQSVNKKKEADKKDTFSNRIRNPDRNPSTQQGRARNDAKKLRQGSTLVKKRLYHQAIDVLQPLLMTTRQEWEVWFWMGTAEMGLGRFQKAREYFREGLERDETIPELWIQYAIAEHQVGRYSQAEKILRQALRLAPALPQVHLNLALALESAGNIRGALRHYRQFLSLTQRKTSFFSTRRKVLDRILNLERS